jgi:hypothetical protein
MFVFEFVCTCIMPYSFVFLKYIGCTIVQPWPILRPPYFHFGNGAIFFPAEDRLKKNESVTGVDLKFVKN